MSSDLDPRETAPSRKVSRDPVEPVPHRRPARQRRSPFQFKFDKKHACAIVKGVYSRMIRNLQLSDGSQDLQYIHALLVDP